MVTIDELEALVNSLEIQIEELQQELKEKKSFISFSQKRSTVRTKTLLKGVRRKTDARKDEVSSTLTKKNERSLKIKSSEIPNTKAGIVYNDSELKEVVKKIAKPLRVETQRVETLEEGLKRYTKAHHSEHATGDLAPSSFVDLGQSLIVFFLGAVSSGVTWDLIKKTIRSSVTTLRKKSKKKYAYFLISDGEERMNYHENLYFFIPVSLTEKELTDVLSQVERIVKAIERLKQYTRIDGSLRFYYEEGNIVLKKLISSDDLY